MNLTLRSAFLVFVLMSFGSTLFSQFGYTRRNSKNFKHYLETKELIVELSGNTNFDDNLRSSVKDIWTDKTLRYLTKEEVSDLSSDKKHVILGVVQITVSQTDNGAASSSRQEVGYGLHITNLENKSSKITNVLSYVSFMCYDGYLGANNAECAYAETTVNKLNTMLYTIWNIADYIKDHRVYIIKKKTFQTRYNEDFQKERKEIIRNKKLLINENDLTEKLTEEKLMKIYPYEVDIVSNEKFNTIINTDSPDYVALMVSGNGRVHAYTFDLESKKTLSVEFDQKKNVNSISRQFLRPTHIKNVKKSKPIKNRVINRALIVGWVGFLIVLQ